MVDAALLIVKFVHVASAMLWLGGSAYLAFRPASAGNVDGSSSQWTRRWLHGAALSTVLFGFELARREFGSLNPFAWTGNHPQEGGPVFFAMLLALTALSIQAWRMRQRPAPDQMRITFRIQSALLAFALFLMIAAGLGGF